MEEQQEELQEEMERLKGLIAVSYGEAEGLRSQIEELKEERVKNIKVSKRRERERERK